MSRFRRSARTGAAAWAAPAWLGGLAGFTLILIGATGLVAAGKGDVPSVTVVGGNAPINVGATDALDVTAHNSPVIAVDPTDAARIVVASRISTPRFGCALHRSVDGGVTFTAVGIGTDGSDTVGCFGPDVAFDASGRVHLAYTSFAEVPGRGTVPRAVHVTSSDDGGATWSAPIEASGPLAFNLRLTADPGDPRRLYLTWVQTSGASGFGFTDVGNPVVVASSGDGGASWSEPVEVSPPRRLRVVAPVIAVGTDGVVHVAYLDVGEDRLDYHGAHEGRGGPAYPASWSLVVSRSTDGGASWTDGTVVGDVTPRSRFLALFPPAPALAAVDGSVYLAFHDARSGDADVWLWASQDDGESFEPPRRVNDTPLPDGTEQYLPALAVADHRLDVVYYDRRADPDDQRNEVSFQSSFDGGRTFTPRTVLSDGAFDADIGFGADRDLADLGDRLGLAAVEGGTLAAWSDTRAGTAANGKQDLARALIAIAGPSASARVVRWAGGALAAIGAVLVGRSVRRRHDAVRSARAGAAGSATPASGT